MKTSKSLEIIYKLMTKIEGPAYAKETVCSIVFNILDELEEEGVDVTEETIEKKLSQRAEDFLKSSKKVA